MTPGTHRGSAIIFPGGELSYAANRDRLTKKITTSACSRDRDPGHDLTFITESGFAWAQSCGLQVRCSRSVKLRTIRN
jgi:hypothetical protein